MSIRARVAILFALATSAACANQPASAPTSTGCVPVAVRGASQGIYAPACVPDGPQVRCTVKIWKLCTQSTITTTDVTASATWEVKTDSTLFSSPISSAAVVSAPGLITPVARGIVAIWASYPGYAGEPATNTFALDPAQPAIPLAPFFGGYVVDATGATLSGVLIEIVDGGPDTGRSTTTDAGGNYQFANVSVNITLTVRASKAGYITSTQVQPGIVNVIYDDTLDFHLTRVASAP